MCTTVMYESCFHESRCTWASSEILKGKFWTLCGAFDCFLSKQVLLILCGRKVYVHLV